MAACTRHQHAGLRSLATTPGVMAETVACEAPSLGAVSPALAARGALGERQKAHAAYLQQMQEAARAKAAFEEAASELAERKRRLLRGAPSQSTASNLKTPHLAPPLRLSVSCARVLFNPLPAPPDRVLKRNSSCPPALLSAASGAHNLSPNGKGGDSPVASTSAITNGSRRALAGRCGPVPTLADYLSWRKRLRIPDGTRVFCMAGSGRHSGEGLVCSIFQRFTCSG